MAKKKGDINISPPAANVSLDDLPVKYEDFQGTFETWMLTRDREHLWRAEIQYTFLKAKDEGLASTGKLWGRQPVPQKAGPSERYKNPDELLKSTLTEMMADDDLTLMEAARKAVELGGVDVAFFLRHGAPPPPENVVRLEAQG